MKCPYCGNEMKSGFVSPLGRGGLCWLSENKPMVAPRKDPGFIQLGKAPWLSADAIPGFNCESCKRIIIDYSKDRDV